MDHTKKLGEQFRSVSGLLWDLMGPRLPRFGFGLIFMMLGRFAGLVAPSSTKYLVDDVILNHRHNLLLPLVLALFGAALVQAGCTYAVTNIISIEGHRMVAQLRRRLQVHVCRLPVRYFDANKVGILASRIISDVDGTRNLMGYVFVEYVGSIVTALFSLIYLLRINAVLTVAVVVAGILFTIVSRKRLTRLRPMFREESRLQAELSGRLVESLNGIRVVKGYRAETREELTFSAGVERQFANAWATSKAMTSMIALNAIVVGGVTAGVTLVAVKQIFAGHLTLGGFVTFTAYVTFLIGPLSQLPGIWTQLTQAVAGLDRAHELLLEKTEDDDLRRVETLDLKRGRVSFEQVTFSYLPGQPALRDISFVAEPGTVTALVGSSGSGKSTIIALIASFYSPAIGVVTVDGIDLSTVRLESYRSQLGVVFQETFLFDGTVRENIMFARPGASEGEMLNAARLAHVHEFAERLPQGYDTMVGERGVKLSGGQRQRISIARAILADPKILLLDEATSSLDSESEAAIQKGLSNLMLGRTTFVIAHRLSTIHRADQILVVESGTVVERGTHESLYSAQGRYHNLYTRQHIGESLFVAPGEGAKAGVSEEV